MHPTQYRRGLRQAPVTGTWTVSAAGGPARKCGAILNILWRREVLSEMDWKTAKEMVARMVAQL